MILMIRRLKRNEEARLFCPPAFTSQPCESFFRRMRSQTSTLSTVVNFTFLQMLHRIRRYESMVDFDTKYSDEFHHQKTSHRTSNLSQSRSEVHQESDSPSDDDIKAALKTSWGQAFKIMTSLLPPDYIIDASHGDLQVTKPSHVVQPGVNPDSLNAEGENAVDFESDDEERLSRSTSDDEESVLSEDKQDDEVFPQDVINDLPVIGHSLSIFSKFLSQQDLTAERLLELKDSQYCVVRTSDKDGPAVPIKKSTLLWLLRQGDEKLSSDRLRRVLVFSQRVNPSATVNVLNDTVVATKIEIGDWVMFREQIQARQIPRRALIGRILHFGALGGQRCHQLEETELDMPCKDKNIGVLSQWFELSVTGIIIPAVVNQGYCDPDLYVCSVPAPSAFPEGSDGSLSFGFSTGVLEKILKVSSENRLRVF